MIKLGKFSEETKGEKFFGPPEDMGVPQYPF